MSISYRITWEGVMPMGKGSCYYRGSHPVCPPVAVLDEAWTAGENITDDPWDQYNKLKEWEQAGVELIRNVQLFKRTDPEWELVPTTSTPAEPIIIEGMEENE